MHNQAGYRWFVVNVNTISIDSGWENLSDANDRALALKDEGGVPKVMTKPRVGAQVLDPNDDASWTPKRNNPSQGFVCPACGARGNKHSLVHKSTCSIRYPRPGQRRKNPLENPRTKQRVVTETRVVRTVMRGPIKKVRRNPGELLIVNPEIGAYVKRVGSSRVYQVDDVDDTGAVICDVTTGECFRVPLDEFVNFTEAPRENPGELLILNPAEVDSARAERVYQMWHQKEPHNISIKRPGVDMDDVMVCVGHAHNIVYRSGKWEQGRKTNDYVHHFDSKPKVWMLERVLGDEDLEECSSATKTVHDLVRSSMNGDGQCAVADLATPISFGLDDGTSEGEDISIHSGARVYGAVDKKTVIIFDPTWRIVVIRGGKMTFDERGIVK